MKVSESWLREWVNPTLTVEELAAILTQAGLEVDGVAPVAGDFDKVVVARVVETKRHPQADKLTLCDVDAGQDELLRIVCGASNVRSGLMVALALPGAHLPGGLFIKESTLRGELSQGMLCSSTELGLDDQADGIIELPQDAPIGESLRSYLDLNDHVIDIDLTPNRGDCFSVRGIAREVAALTRLEFKELNVSSTAVTHQVARGALIEAQDACSYFVTREIHDIKPDAETPLWIKERLRRVGVRPLHPVVDVMNYVMFELGVPMHAYDTRFVQGDLRVRMATAGERLTLLTEQEIELRDNLLVIADDREPLALAGIMGGEKSAVRADTTQVIIESAFFNPLSMAGVARSYGLSTDASMRFERGVDPSLQKIAIERASALLLTIVGGKVGPLTVVTNEAHAEFKSKQITFVPSRVSALTGIIIPELEMLLLLESLGLTIEQQSSVWQVTIPSYRFDLALEVDLIEEVIRLYGYDKLHAEPICAPFRAGQMSLSAKRTHLITHHLIARGYNETISYSFVDPVLQHALYPEHEFISLANPISSELSEMRASIWPGLLATLMHNLHRQQSLVQCFETGVVFDVCDAVVREKQVVSGLLAGETGALNWSETKRNYDFYDMKGDIESLFYGLGCLSSLRFESEPHHALHPGQSARIYFGEQPVGWFGVLHPRLADSFDVAFDVMLFEIFLDDIPTLDRVQYQPISKYPSISRDLSLLVDEHLPVSEIEKVIRGIVSRKQLKAFDVFDCYIGEGIPQGKKSIAITLTLQNDDRTLIDSEINTIIDAILKKLKDELNIILRE